MTNKYPANCKNCQSHVAPGEGVTNKDATTGKWITVHAVCGNYAGRGSSVAGAMNAHRAILGEQDDISYDAWVEFLDDEDEQAADEYISHVIGLVRAAFASRSRVGETDRGAYYDITTYAFAVDPTLGLDANSVRSILAAGDGQSMASYGTFGGYSTIGNVRATDDAGVFTVESVYHIGD